MKEPKVIEMFADNGEHSYWQLIDENGEILWSEEPTEVKNNAVLPLVSDTVCHCYNNECMHQRGNFCMAAQFNCEDRQTGR